MFGVYPESFKLLNINKIFLKEAMTWPYYHVYRWLPGQPHGNLRRSVDNLELWLLSEILLSHIGQKSVVLYYKNR